VLIFFLINLIKLRLLKINQNDLYFRTDGV